MRRSALLLLVLSAALACGKRGDLGRSTSWLMVEPERDAEGQMALDASGLPIFRKVADGDPRAAPVRPLLEGGALATIIALEYAAKTFVQQASSGDRRYGGGARLEGREPTVLVLNGKAGDVRDTHLGVGFAMRGLLATTRYRAAWIEVGADPSTDTALAQTLSYRLGRLAALRIATREGLGTLTVPADYVDSGEATVLADGFGLAVEVIGRQLAVLDRPGAALTAGTELQRQRIQSVLQNRFMFADEGGTQLRHPDDLLSDPGVTGSFLYQLTQSAAARSAPAPAAVYAPFLQPDAAAAKSPAGGFGAAGSVLIKCLAAWGARVLENRPPRDLPDLVEAYGQIASAERADVARLFVMQTLGATVATEGVLPARRRDGSELAALAEDVAAGRRAVKAAAGTPDRDKLPGR